MGSVYNLAEFRIYPSWKCLVVLKQWSHLMKRKVINIIYEYYTVGISHGYAGHFVFLAIHLYRTVYNCVTLTNYRYKLRLKDRLTHIYSYHINLAVLYEELKVLYSGKGLNRNLGLVSETVIINVFAYAADSVSAHLRLGSVCIEHSHSEICHLTWTYQDKSV